MAARNFLLCAAFCAALGFLANSSSHAEHPACVSKKQKLTPERAKQALLKMIRSKPGKQLGWFKGNIPREMAKLKIKREKEGWYAWTGAFRFNPTKTIYTFVVRPRPGFRACAFKYRGSFVRKHRHWAATPPKLVSAALHSGE
jgi:hypothetical protein